MKQILLTILMFMMLACSTEPQALEYGKDGCFACKMTLMDKKFGAEIVTTKGKVYKFDDVNCMITYVNTSTLNERDIAHQLVVDFATPEKFVDANQAFFLKSENIKSPMASQVAAFSKKEELENVKMELGGIYLVWGELVTQFK
jgi:copper chaperone NosL